MSDTITGGCLCGAVRYTTQGPARMAGHCYCEARRRSSATTHSTHVVLQEEGFALTGDLTAFDKPADSGNVVTRCFCPTCGSPILSRNSGMPGMVFIRAASMDDMEQIAPTMTVYAAQAPSWAKVDHDHPVFEQEFPGLAEGRLPDQA